MDSLFDLREATLSLRPVVDFDNRQESEEERKARRLSTFYESHNRFARVIISHQPFYPEKIFKALNEIRVLAIQESRQYQYLKLSANLDGYWDKAQANQAKIVDAIDRACVMIRRRIST